MNSSQMQMLSAKSAIERTVLGIVASYNVPSTLSAKEISEQIYDAICRYMSSLFVSRQIDSDFTVFCDAQKRNIDIKFSCGEQRSGLTFTNIIPKPLAQKPIVLEPAPAIVDLAPVTAIREFVDAQAALGQQFQQVLHDNAWDLYEGEPNKFTTSKWIATALIIFATMSLLSPIVAATSVTPWVLFLIANIVYLHDSYTLKHWPWFGLVAFCTVWDVLLIISRTIDPSIFAIATPLLTLLEKLP